jgi:hypothetical protein
MVKVEWFDVVQYWEAFLASIDEARNTWRTNTEMIGLMRRVRSRRNRQGLYQEAVERVVADRLKLIGYMERWENEEDEKKLNLFVRMVIESPELRAEVMDVTDKQLAHWHQKLGIREHDPGQ